MSARVKVVGVKPGYARVERGGKLLGTVTRHKRTVGAATHTNPYATITETWWAAEVETEDEYGYGLGPLRLERGFDLRRDAVEAVLRYHGVSR